MQLKNMESPSPSSYQLSSAPQIIMELMSPSPIYFKSHCTEHLQLWNSLFFETFQPFILSSLPTNVVGMFSTYIYVFLIYIYLLNAFGQKIKKYEKLVLSYSET